MRRAIVTAFVVAVAAPAWAHNYVGAQACGSCHAFEYQVWSQGPHARAHLSLTPEQQQDGRCNSCHSNAQVGALEALPSDNLILHEPGSAATPAPIQAALAASTGTPAPRDANFLGVQCESCHGPGALYQPDYVMRDRELSRLVGLVDPTPASCLACHNDGAPSLKPFNYKAAWALIDHGREAREAFEAKLAKRAPPSAAGALPSGADLEVDDAQDEVRSGPATRAPAAGSSTEGRRRVRHRRGVSQRSSRSSQP